MCIVTNVSRILTSVLFMVVLCSGVSAQWARLQTDTTHSVEYFFANENAVIIEPFGTLRYFSDEERVWKTTAINNPFRIFHIIPWKNDLIGILYAPNQDSIFHSTDGGKSWSRFGGHNFGTRFRGLLENGTLFYAVGKDIKRLVDPSGYWQDYGTRPFSVGSYESICRDDRHYYLGTTNGGVMRSSDSAKTWSFDTVGIGKRFIGKLLVAGGVVFGSFKAGGVFRSTNHGDNWVRNTTYLPDSVLVASLNRYGWVVFASTNRGLYRTTDGGETWDRFNQGFPENEQPDVRGVGVHRGYLYAGLVDHDVWRIPLKDVFPPGSIVDFDSSYIGASRDSLLPNAVHNSTPDTLFFTGASVEEEDAADFRVVGSLDTMAIPPGESFSVVVRFSPIQTGNRHTTLVVHTIDRSGNLARNRFLLVGQGLESPYEALTTAIDFGRVQVGDSIVRGISAVRTTGGQQLTIDSVSVVGTNGAAFSVTGGGGSTILQPGSELALQVQFLPDQLDTLRGEARVWGRGSVLTRISLIGIGYEPPVSVPGVRVSITGMDVSPLPVVGRATIRFVANHVGPVSIGLYNLQSQQVWSQEGVIADPGEQLWTMDVRDLPDGVYIVRVVANGSVLTRKVVVAR